MAALGGRSPYEVVTGLKPRFPRSILGAVPVMERTIDGCVKDLMEHLKEVHSSVQWTVLAAIEREEATMAGHLSQELEVGDPVLVRRESTAERKGPTRFQSRVYDGIFVIKRKVSPTTFVVEDLVDKEYVPKFLQPLHAERLVRLDMSELGLEPGQPRRLEMRESSDEPWNTYILERFGADGRVRLLLQGGAAETRKWVDLTKCEYRWLQ
jgi:hypothetical protein